MKKILFVLCLGILILSGCRKVVKQTPQVINQTLPVINQAPQEQNGTDNLIYLKNKTIVAYLEPSDNPDNPIIYDAECNPYNGITKFIILGKLTVKNATTEDVLATFDPQKYELSVLGSSDEGIVLSASKRKFESSNEGCGDETIETKKYFFDLTTLKTSEITDESYTNLRWATCLGKIFSFSYPAFWNCGSAITMSYWSGEITNDGAPVGPDELKIEYNVYKEDKSKSDDEWLAELANDPTYSKIEKFTVNGLTAVKLIYPDEISGSDMMQVIIKDNDNYASIVPWGGNDKLMKIFDKIVQSFKFIK